MKLLISIVTLFMVGCSIQEKNWENVSPVFIKEEAKQYIASTKVVISVDQDKRLGIPVLGQRTSHQYFGVVGKLAEGADVRFANDLSDEHRHLLREVDKAAFNFDIGTKFRENANSHLRTLKWLKISSVVNQTDLQISEIEQIAKTLDEDALLIIDNRYLMAFDFRAITVFSNVTLYAHDENLVKIAKAAKPYEDPPTLYNHLFSFEYPYENTFSTADEALKGWALKDGEMVKRAIIASIKDLTNQIITDLSFTTSK